jgi:glycosyltransferase involved in cell wall biosynthesis
VLPFLNLTGGNLILLELANRLAARGHRVWMLFEHANVPWWKARGFTRLAFRDHGMRPWVDWFDLRVPVVRCPRLEDRHVPDADAIVVSHWRDAPQVAALSAAKGRKLYYVQAYETDFPADAETKIAIDATYRLPLRHVVASSWLGRTMWEKFEQPSVKIGYGIDFAKFPTPPARRFHDPPRCLMQDHTLAVKGVADGIRAFELARRAVPDLTLSLFGPHRRPLAAAHRALGFVLPADMGRVYLDHDVFIWPSLREGYGLPPVEAMACRCAVATTANGGSDEFARHERTALVSAPGDVEALAASVVRLASDAATRRRLAEAGEASVRRALAWDPVIDAWEGAVTDETLWRGAPA